MEVEGEKIRILLIEDNPGDARLIRELLAEGGGASFDLEHVDCLSTGLTRLAQGNIDVILLDLSLPDSHGLDGLGKILAQTQVVPIVVLSGLKDEAVAIKAVQGGAQDYLVKGNIDSSLLVRSLHYAIERQRLRVALGESEARYRLLADNIADVIWTADSEARITYVSPSIKRVLGYTVEETLKLKISDILTPDSTEQARRFVKWQMKTFARGVQYPPASMTLEHVRKDGSTVWAEVMLSFMQDKNGNVTGIMGATRDITERRKAEEALQKSEARYRLLTDNAVDFIWTMDIKGRVTYASPSAERLFGYSVDELMALKINELFTPSSAETVRKAMKEEMATKATGLQDSHRSLLLEHVRKDGSTVWTEVMMSFLHDEQGRLIGVQGVTRDITERRKAEEALRESEQRYRLLAENVKDVIWTIDMNLRLSYTSPSITQLTGYPHEEYVTKTLEEILTPASVEFVANLFAEELALDNSGHSDLFRARTFEAELICKDGSTVPVEMKATGLRDADGRPIGVLGVSRDITERKKAEEALHQSEERYRELFENANDIIYIHDLAGNFISINKAAELVTGYTRDEVIGMNIARLLTPESMERARQMIVRKVSDGGQTRYELEIVTKDGHKVLLEVNTRLIYEGGKPVGVQGIARDITEREKAENALRESEEKLRRYLESSPDAIYINDEKGTFLYGNLAAERVIGYSKEELIGHSFLELNILPPEYLAKAVQTLELNLAGKPTGPDEFELVRKDGSQIFVEISTYPTTHDDKVEVIGIAREITERRKMEKELRLLSDAVKMSKNSIVISDLEGRIIEANEATLKMHGMDNREDLIGRSALELISAEDHEMVTEKMTTALAGGGLPYILEYHCIKNDGSTFLCEATISEVKDKKGEHTGYMAVVRDITERKRMEDALRQSEHNYRILFEGTIDGMFVTDTETVTIVLANQTAAKMCGFDSVENTVGINPLDLVHPDDRERVLGFFMEDALGKGEQEVHEFQAITKDGREIWVSGMGTRIEYGGKPAVLSSIRDITERKRMDEALRQSEQSYRVLLESTHDSIIVVDAETFKITFGNRRASMMFGFDPVLQDAVGMNLLDFIHPEDREIAIKGFVEDLHQAERRRRYDVRAKTRDGREIWVSALATRIEFQGKVAVLLSLRDVTKDKLMEEERERLEEELLLAGRLAAVGELAAGVAHELNNPLAAIQGFAQLLTKSNDLKEATKKDLNTIFREAQRAARITQNLLSFARRHEPEKTLISINEAIEKTLELHANPMKVNNIEVELELAPDLPKTLADFHQMQQVFVNIVNNAEQAMVDAHGKGRLVVKTRKAGNMIQISFADNGPGIPEENINRIFDPFFTTKEVGKGTGLGLSICYGLVEAHGGRIYAQSKLGQGATFVVEIPIVTEKQLVAEAALLKSGSRGVTWKKPKGQY
jgi:PAS domain S-box-containing protein